MVGNNKIKRSVSSLKYDTERENKKFRDLIALENVFLSQ